MALTSDELTICNQALAMIGQKSIDSTDTSTADTGTSGTPYVKCELIFDQTRNALFRACEWNFLRTRLALVNSWATATAYTTDQYVWVSSVLYKCSTAHTSTTWNTDYVLDGSDYVLDGTNYVRDDSVTFYWTLVTDRPETYWTYRYALPADFNRFITKWLRHNEIYFSLESNNILCDETDLDINYIKYETDPLEFDALFTEVLILDLAIKLTFTLMGASYQTQALRKGLNIERKIKISAAKSVNAIEQVDKETYPSYRWVNARYGSGKV